MANLSFREMNLAVFRGEAPDHVLWQPRLEFWYAVNKKRGALPEPLAEMSLLELYDYCHASVRYFGHGLRHRQHGVEFWQERLDEKRVRHWWKTPVGTLTAVTRFDAWGLSAYHEEYRVKTPEDLQILEYLLEHEEWYWDQEAYEASLAEVGDRGAPQFYFRRSPLQNLFIAEMGFQTTIFMLYDRPEVLHRYIEVQTQADDALYEVLSTCPVGILNFGENIDAHMDPPTLWHQYMIPYYRRRTQYLHEAGKFVHIHVDGAMKPLLGHLRDCPWDGIEAATPLPQGDVTIEQIKDALGDLVLLDGVPAVFFLPTYREQELIDCVRRLVDLFYPRLVLGISDEIPPDGDIERVRMVGELCRELP
ncbi:MAG: uroporphyrinogen decarboxylase family protein [Armatimonadota bacterium]